MAKAEQFRSMDYYAVQRLSDLYAISINNCIYLSIFFLLASNIFTEMHPVT